MESMWGPSLIGTALFLHGEPYSWFSVDGDVVRPFPVHCLERRGLEGSVTAMIQLASVDLGAHSSRTIRAGQ